MTENLPGELLTNISIYLSRRDLRTCLHVCRSWNATFTPIFYSAVEIHSERQLRRFTKALRHAEVRNPLGHIVRTITLQSMWTVGHGSIASLPSVCPLVTEFHATTWRAHFTEALEKWKHLTKISEVYLCESLDFPSSLFQKQITKLHLNVVDSPEKWLDLVTHLPCIEKLTVGFGNLAYIDTQKCISLSDLEKLHSSLPRLRSFEMQNVATYGEMPEYITPCDTVCELILSPLNACLWAEYFAQKYTNLKIFTLMNHFSGEVKADTMVFLKSCKHLEQFHCLDSTNTIFYQDAYKTLYEIDAPLARLEFFEWSTIPYEETVNNFHRTVTNIRCAVSHKSDATTSDELVKPLKNCLLLTELTLIYGSCVMEADLAFVLDHCQSLETLDIVGQTILVSNYHAADDRHNLRLLRIGAKDIEDSVFPYLSQRCPRLSDIDCHYRANRNKNCMVYFPSPALKRLSVQSQQDAIIRLTQTGKTEKIIKRNIRYRGSVDGQKTKIWTRWYHAFWEDCIVKIRRVKLLENYESSGQLTNYNTGDIEKAFQESGYTKTPYRQHNTFSISIQCYSVDEIRLLGIYL
ncbi:hypothetical protein DFQ30_009310 [Apophysomyces sp. BC1015]|nr:hypothetical protein DFQ30_009310 [Apophysomyces sp. BC1015]